MSKIQNTLAATVAPPVPLLVQTEKNEVTLYFNQVSIGHREMLTRRFGIGGVEKIIQELNFPKITEMLFLLLTKDSKEALDELDADFSDYDIDKDEVVDKAPRRIDRFRYVVGSDMGCAGGLDLRRLWDDRRGGSQAAGGVPGP